MTKIHEYDKFIARAKKCGFEIHPCGEYYYKKVNVDKDTYIYIGTCDKVLWVERGHKVVQGLDEILLLPKRLQRYV